MPRRRMIDPFFWNDRKIARLSRDERSLVIGCVGHADDEGRLEADPAYLKAMIFKYDEDLDNTAVENLRESCLSKMESWPVSHPYRMVLYQSSDEEYIYFPSWYGHQAPSHPQPSKLPAPPNAPDLGEPFTDEARQEVYERDNYTCQYCAADLSQNARMISIDHVLPLTRGGTHRKSNLVTACKSCNLKKRNKTPEEAGMSLVPTCKVNLEVNHGVNLDVNPITTQDRSGQSSLGKVSIVKSSAVAEDFRNYLDSESDLTDFLTTTLTKYLPRGPTAAVDVLYKLWEQAMGQTMPQTIFQLTFDAARKYPVPVLARSYAKLVKYKGGKTGSWKYLDKILKEQMEKEKPP